MMMKTAGGPGLVSPIDFGDRRKPLPRWAWVAIGASVVVHGAIGVALYTQRFQIAEPAPLPDGPPIEVFMAPRPAPPKPIDNPPPPAPNPPIHTSTPISTPTEVLNVPPVETPGPVVGPVINLTHPVPPTSEGLAAAPAEPAPIMTVITRPSWQRKPNGAQLMNAYPNRAITAGVEGAATLQCAVRLDGTLTQCAVVSESPGGYGFGRAALGLSRYFRMNPGAVNGRSIDGARVDVGVRFTLPDR